MRVPPPSLWILNLDAEHELEAQRSYAPNRRLISIVEHSRKQLWNAPTPLVQPGDLVLADASTEPAILASPNAKVACLRTAATGRVERVELARGQLAHYRGRAWLPTPRARTVLRALGVAHATVPAAETLRQVNARDFAVAVRAQLTHAGFVKRVASSLEQALEELARPAALGWLVRRRFGAAGRGRRRIHAVEPPSAAELAWLTASLRSGPLVIEPWVAITTEFTRSGHITESGELLISAPCFQATSATGAWTHTEGARRGEIGREDDECLSAALEAAGRDLQAAGYFGAFGIDAFRYRDEAGVERLNPLSEINARYTMDLALAMNTPRLEQAHRIL